jgi:hypothetical protein
MKALVLAIVTTIGVGVTTAAAAQTWFDGPPWFAAPYAGDQPSGGPYIVAGFGDDPLGQPRYWGGPYWTMCRGTHPPFQTYRIPPASCRPWAVKVATGPHRRVIRARLK